jgi:hypothetical protein
MRHMLLALLLLATSASMSEAGEPQCWWKPKEGDDRARTAGIACQHNPMHYEVAMLSCEGGPLSLMLQSYCGDDRPTCAVRMTLDSRTYDLVGENIWSGEIWDGIIDIPLQGQEEVINALGRASRFELDIERAEQIWIVPTTGLSETVDTLRSSCDRHLK